MTLTLAQLRTLPKIELHRHLDCSMRWSTVQEIAKTMGLSPDPESFLVTEPMVNLDAVLKKFLNTQKLLNSEEILTRLAFEACEDAFNENIKILELRFAPTFISEGHTHLSHEKILKAFLKGLKMAEEKMGISTGLIGILQRIKPLNEAAKVMDFFCEHKENFIAVDLADNEEGFDPKPFAPLFQKAKKAGLKVTIHSGESPSPSAGQWILDSIEHLGADRIGHGVQSIHHPKVIQTLIDKSIPLEVCPYSNWLTQAFANLKDHPLKKLLDLGVPVTLSSDDPGVFASSLTDDYEIAQRVHQLTPKDFKKMNRIAFEKSFLPVDKKKKWETTFL
jgi:adenosine deaminase